MKSIDVDEILWTSDALASFNKIIEWLKQEWSEKEVEKFINRTKAFILNLQRYPEICRPSIKRKNVRIAILNKHTQLVYHYNKSKRTITILLFWGIKQNPKKFKY